MSKTFFRSPEDLPPENDSEWIDMLHLSQLNSLSLAHLLLAVIDDPDIVGDETRNQILELIEGLEYGIARFEEWVI